MIGHEFSNSESAIHWTAFAKEDVAPLLYPNMCAMRWAVPIEHLNMVFMVSIVSRRPQMRIVTIGSFLAMCMAASKIKSECQNGTMDDMSFVPCVIG